MQVLVLARVQVLPEWPGRVPEQELGALQPEGQALPQLQVPELVLVLIPGASQQVPDAQVSARMSSR